MNRIPSLANDEDQSAYTSHMRNFVFAFCFAVLALCAGCANKEAQLTGKWSGKLTSAQFGKMVESFHPDLELKSDHTFVMSGQGSFEGTWTLKDNTATLKMTKVQGKARSAAVPDMSMTLSSDSKTLSGGDPSGKTDIKFVFTKAAS